MSSSDNKGKTHYHIKKVDKDGNVLSTHDVYTDIPPPVCVKEEGRLPYSLNKFAPIDSLIRIGKNYCSIGSYREAVSVLKEVLNRNSDVAEVHFYLGIAYFGLEDKAAAMNEWQLLKNLDQQMADELYAICFIETEPKVLISNENEMSAQDEPNDKNRKVQEQVFKKPSIFKNPTVLRAIRNKNTWIFTGVAALIIWGAISDNNQPRNPSTKGSNYNQSASVGNNYGDGQYRCSSYHINKAKALEPDSKIKVRLDIEDAELTKLADELKSLQRTIKNTTVNEYSQESINHYNRMVNLFNKQIKLLKSRSADLDNANKLFNDRIDAYNNYLDNNCTKVR